jgi:hypothetical protein
LLSEPGYAVSSGNPEKGIHKNTNKRYLPCIFVAGAMMRGEDACSISQVFRRRTHALTPTGTSLIALIMEIKKINA